MADLRCGCFSWYPSAITPWESAAPRYAARANSGHEFLIAWSMRRSKAAVVCVTNQSPVGASGKPPRALSMSGFRHSSDVTRIRSKYVRSRLPARDVGSDGSTAARFTSACRSQETPRLAADGSRVTGLIGRSLPSGPPATWSATKAPRSPIGLGLPAVVSSAV